MEQQVQFKNHVGEILSGTLHKPDRASARAIIAGHCFTCSRHTGVLRRVCNDLSKNGFKALRFDFSGNGQSQGEFKQSTWSKQVSEMKAAVSWMEKNGATWIGLIGHSLGAAIALLTAQQTKSVSALCRLAGRLNNGNLKHFLTPEQKHTLQKSGEVVFFSRGRELSLPVGYFEDVAQYDLATAMRSLAIPALVVHGDQDEIIPVSEAHLAKSINPEKVELFIAAGGNHMFSDAGSQKRVGQIVVAWFRRQAGLPLGEYL